MIISKNRQITTTSETINHFPYPCPPSRSPDVSCEQAWAAYARQRGRKIVYRDTIEEVERADQAHR